MKHLFPFLPSKSTPLPSFPSPPTTSSSSLPNTSTSTSPPTPTLPPQAVVATMSARVGSITSNSLGGWYSYRASKAALNQCIKT
ncbi:hypothetical protein Q9189_004287, partial [Teloschistes chrysophthalmus]